MLTPEQEEYLAGLADIGIQEQKEAEARQAAIDAVEIALGEAIADAS